MVILILAGIIGSRSQSGLLATSVAGMTCLFLLIRLRGELRSHGAVAIEMGLFVVGLVVWTALLGNFAERRGDGGRRDHLQANWHDSLKVLDDFPVAGAGFGTYRYAYLPYQVRLAEFWFCHADNQFVEILVEAGAIGIGLAVFVIFASLGSTLAMARNPHRPQDDPAGIVGTFAVISQSISACFDFGTTVPANMLTLALILGLVTGRAARLADNEDPKTWWLACPGMRPAWMILLVGFALSIHGFMGWGEVLATAQVRRAMREVPEQLVTKDALSEQQLNSAIRRMTAAALRRPDDAEAQRKLGELWIYRYRLATLAELNRQSPDEDSAISWSRTDVAALYAQANDWAANGQANRLADLRESILVSENLRRARWHFLAAQKASPLLPGVDVPLAMLDFLDPAAMANGEVHLSRAIALTPTDPELLETTAVLAESANLHDFAFGCWRRELIFKPQALQKTATYLAGRLSIEQQMARVLPNSPEAFLELATTVYAGPGHEEARTILLKNVVQMISEKIAAEPGTGEEFHQIARAHNLLGEYDSAIEDYRKALSLDPLQLDWRLELVDVLRMQGRISVALKQAELCLAVAPDRKEIRELVSQLRIKTEIAPDPSVDPDPTTGNH